MCLFRKAPLIAERNLTEDQAIESYRGFDVNYGGLLCSPYRGNVWRELKAHTICGGAENQISTGFHSLKQTEQLSEHDGSLIARVKIWGKVYEYAEHFVGVDAFNSSHGYLSEWLQIIEIVETGRPGIWQSPEYMRECLREAQIQYEGTELTFSQELKDEYEFLSS